VNFRPTNEENNKTGFGSGGENLKTNFDDTCNNMSEREIDRTKVLHFLCKELINVRE
jgi:hypothetical protein